MAKIEDLQIPEREKTKLFVLSLLNQAIEQQKKLEEAELKLLDYIEGLPFCEKCQVKYRLISYIKSGQEDKCTECLEKNCKVCTFLKGDRI